MPYSDVGNVRRPGPEFIHPYREFPETVVLTGASVRQACELLQRWQMRCPNQRLSNSVLHLRQRRIFGTSAVRGSSSISGAAPLVTGFPFLVNVNSFSHHKKGLQRSRASREFAAELETGREALEPFRSGHKRPLVSARAAHKSVRLHLRRIGGLALGKSEGCSRGQERQASQPLTAGTVEVPSRLNACSELFDCRWQRRAPGRRNPPSIGRRSTRALLWRVRPRAVSGHPSPMP